MISMQIKNHVEKKGVDKENSQSKCKGKKNTRTLTFVANGSEFFTTKIGYRFFFGSCFRLSFWLYGQYVVIAFFSFFLRDMSSEP